MVPVDQLERLVRIQQDELEELYRRVRDLEERFGCGGTDVDCDDLADKITAVG